MASASTVASAHLSYATTQESGIKKSLHEGVQNRHSIMTRRFVYVDVGVVHHLRRPQVMEVPGCKSMFCFSGATGCAGELQVTERSCYECEDCSQLDKASCKNTPYTGPTHGTGVRLSSSPSVNSEYEQ